MNEEIAEILGKHFPFEPRQILDLYLVCKSWDAVLVACENSRIMGTSTLTLEYDTSSFDELGRVG